MSNDGGVNSFHICLLPCEHILVLSQKLGKETSKVVCEFGTDVGEVFRIIIQRYGLQLFRGLRSGVYLVVHVELVQVYVVDCFLLHGCRVTLPGYALVSSNHSYSACGQKLNHHMVSGGNDLYGVERGPA